MGSANKKQNSIKEEVQLQLLYGEDSQFKHWESHLFNEVYLRRDLPEQNKALWEETEVTNFQNLMKTLRDLAAEYKNREKELSNWSETETINNWVKHVLVGLGWADNCSGVQNPFLEETSFRYDSKTYRTDILIVDHPREKQLVNERVGDDKVVQARETILIPVEVKYWQRLEEYRQGSKEEKRKIDTDEDDISKITTPDEQTIQYMNILKKEWGILTDGATWRLFSNELSSEDSNRYFEFNLYSLFKSLATEETEADRLENVESAKYFYHFFSKQAFAKEDGHDSFVGKVLNYSKKYVSRVEEDLKERFVKAMNIACNGLHRASKNAEIATIRNVAESALFNILFIKSLESRGVLPMASTDYKKLSLSSIIDKIERFDPDKDTQLNQRDLERAFKKGNGNAFIYTDAGTELHDRIFRLTLAIHEGSPSKESFGFEIEGFKESVFSSEEWRFFKECKLTNSEWVKILFQLGYARSESLNRKYQQIPYSYFTPRQLGSIYESFLEFKLDKAAMDMAFIEKQWSDANLLSEKIRKLDVPKVRKGELFFTPDNEDRRETASYYTPDHVVRFIVAKTLSPLVKGKSSKELLTLKVCDPAMGSGHFLAAAMNYLARHYLAALDKELKDDLDVTIPQAKFEVLKKCIFGIDINPRAVKLAKLSLWLESAQPGCALENLEDQLFCKDFLEVVSKKTVPFKADCFLSNPPYGESFSPEYKAKVLKLFSEIQEGRNVEIYQFFLYAITKVMADGSRIGFIAPNTWLSAMETKKFQDHFAKALTPDCFVHLPSKVFKAATVDCAIYVGGMGGKSTDVAVADLRESLPNETLFNDYSEISIPLATFRNGFPKVLFEDAVIQHLNEATSKVDTFFEMVEGIHPYKTAADRSKKYITSSPQGAGPWKKVLASGKALKIGKVTWEGEYVKYGPWLHNQRDPRFFENNKVLVHRLKNRSCFKRLTAGIDTNKYYTTTNLTPIIVREGCRRFEMDYLNILSALLNSKVINYWYGLQFDNVNILISRVRSIPMPDSVSKYSGKKKLSKELQALLNTWKETKGVETFDKLRTATHDELWTMLVGIGEQIHESEERKTTLGDLIVAKLFGMNKAELAKVLAYYDKRSLKKKRKEEANKTESRRSKKAA